VARVADEQHIEVGRRPPEQTQLGRGKPRGDSEARLPAPASPFPDARVVLDDVDVRTAKAGITCAFRG
jgi:hypothetical protein